MPISEHGKAIALLVTSSALLAQSGNSLVTGQNHASEPDVRQIVGSSIAATQRHWQERLHYTYLESARIGAWTRRAA